MNARRRSLDKWAEDDGRNPMQENSSSANHRQTSPSNHDTSYQPHQFNVINDNNDAYASSASDPILTSFCGPPGGHLHFPPAHHLHSHGLHQQGPQYLGQANQMLVCNSISPTNLIHSYQTTVSVPQATHLIPPR